MSGLSSGLFGSKRIAACACRNKEKNLVRTAKGVLAKIEVSGAQGGRDARPNKLLGIPWEKNEGLVLTQLQTLSSHVCL